MAPRPMLPIVLCAAMVMSIAPAAEAQEHHEIDLAELDAGITVTLSATKEVKSVRVVNLVPGRTYVVTHQAERTEIAGTVPTPSQESDPTGCCQRGKMIAPQLCSAADP